MKIESLWLSHFRNYDELSIDLSPQVNLFIGQNGQGKSNLLEAIQLLLSGQSFRPAANHDFISIGHENSRVKAEIETRSGKKSVDFQLTAQKKEHNLNGKKVAVSRLLKEFGSVVFSPESLAIIKQGPGERRDLLDQILTSIQPERATLIFDYEKCLRTRNRVLKDHLEGQISNRETWSLLESLNPSFLPLATKLVGARIETIKNIIPRAKTALKSILQDDSVDISVDYVISEQSAIDWPENSVYDALKLRLHELQEAELRSGQSLVGPHKHDVRFNFNGKDARFFCSQGQQRSIVLAFKIAQIMQHHEVNEDYPILLLDDVFSELDAQKRENLLATLSEVKAQIILTTTELETSRLFAQRDLTVFTIEKGHVKTAGWN